MHLDLINQLSDLGICSYYFSRLLFCEDDSVPIQPTQLIRCGRELQIPDIPIDEADIGLLYGQLQSLQKTDTAILFGTRILDTAMMIRIYVLHVATLTSIPAPGTRLPVWERCRHDGHKVGSTSNM